MTAMVFRPTYLLDAETLVDRAHETAVISEAMRMNREVWIFDDDEERCMAARRIAFMRWAVEVGEVHDGR